MQIEPTLIRFAGFRGIIKIKGRKNVERKRKNKPVPNKARKYVWVSAQSLALPTDYEV